MTTQHATQRPGLLAALCATLLTGLAAAGLLLATPAQASIRTITLTAQGPSPAQLTIGKGDVVNFFNTDNVSHTVTRTTGGWAFNAVIEAGKSKATSTFTATGTFGYSDSHAVVLNDAGTIVVKAAAPAPTTSPKPSPKPSPTTSPVVKPTATSTPTASPTTQPTRSGTAIGPGIGVGTFPSASPGATAGPRPDVAAPEPSESGAVQNLGYSDRGLVQDSPHRYGLPAALALVAILGVLSLLVRLLLAEPAARRHR